MLDTLCQFKTVHHWHRNIADNDVWALFANQFPCLTTIISQHHFKVITKFGSHKVTHVGIILNNQQPTVVERLRRHLFIILQPFLFRQVFLYDGGCHLLCIISLRIDFLVGGQAQCEDRTALWVL